MKKLIFSIALVVVSFTQAMQETQFAHTEQSMFDDKLAQNALTIYKELNASQAGILRKSGFLDSYEVNLKTSALRNIIEQLLLQQHSYEDALILSDMHETTSKCAQASFALHQASKKFDNSCPEFRLKMQKDIREAYVCIFGLLFEAQRNIELLEKLTKKVA